MPRQQLSLDPTLDPELLDRVLTAFELEPDRPSRAFLGSLHREFVKAVPFENFTKIRKAALPVPVEKKPRLPEEVFADFLGDGAGGTCFARTYAYHALLLGLGFRSRLHLGGVKNEYDHAATVVEIDDEHILSDVGLPLLGIATLAELPQLFRFPAYDFRIEARAPGNRLRPVVRGTRELFENRDDCLLVTKILAESESPFFCMLAQPASGEEYARHWLRTFRKDGPFLGSITVTRHERHRILVLKNGEVRYLSKKGETSWKLAGDVEAKISKMFGLSPVLVKEALRLKPLI